MAKNDAVSVLHATLDYRRSIDVPGYDKIDLHPAARFIGTMNYGYAGTKELNEATCIQVFGYRHAGTDGRKRWDLFFIRCSRMPEKAR